MPKPDERNMTPPLSQRGFWVFVVAVAIAGTAVTVGALRELRAPDAGDASLLIVAGLLLLLEVGPIIVHRRRYTSGVSASMMFIFALILHWGLAGVALAIVAQAAATSLAGVVVGKVVWRSIFNITQYAICLGVAYLAILPFGIKASLDSPAPIGLWMLPALLASAVLALTVNTVLVGTSIALQMRTSWWQAVIVDIYPLAPLNDGAAIAIAPLVVMAAERGPWLVPLLLVPLFAVYKSSVVSQALKHQADHDALTGLPNRTHLQDSAQAEFATQGVNGSVVGLFVIDLDRFKEINDTLGHRAGDQLLQIVGDRLRGAVRPNDLVARLGGDEFAVLLPKLDDEAAARAVAARITSAVRAPMRIDGVMLNIDSSLGIALAPNHGADFETLLQHADVAMYSAKQRGTSYETYSAEFNTGASGRLNLLNDLRRALEEEPESELELHYQPQVCISDGRLVGVEALLRWRHPVRGLLLPEEFIDHVERTALMSSLTRWVIDDALHQAARWVAADVHVRVAVNVSVADLHREEFAEYVAFRLLHHRVEAGLLQLEITEGALMVDPGRVLATLHALEGLGVSLSLDDFGTGYSSMSQLHRLPVEEIKLDRSFIAGMQHDVDDRTIVRSMIELGRALGLRVVAEGVENEATWTELNEMGCDDAQGWHISPALPVADMTRWLHLHHRRWPEVAALSGADLA